MKRITSVAFFVLAGLLTAGSMSAQDARVQATIPFNFRVGNTPLPAGTYRIIESGSGVVLLRNQEHLGLTALSMSVPRYSTTSDPGMLVFNRYGNQYFLRQILCADAMSVDLPTSAVEKRAKVQEARLSQTTHVLLAMK